MLRKSRTVLCFSFVAVLLCLLYAKQAGNCNTHMQVVLDKVRIFSGRLPDTRSCITPEGIFNRYDIHKEGCSEVPDEENYVCTWFNAGKKHQQETVMRTQLCVYNSKDIVSTHVRERHQWERKFCDTMEYFLNYFPNSVLLDLGCNVGVFTVWAAATGAKVVGIDINDMNLRLIAKSLRLNGMQENVSLLWNAVSDKHESLSMVRHETNVGSYKVGQSNDSAEIAAVILDDLAPMFKGKSVFIKMDVEGSEWKALSGGRNFFKTVKVTGLMMEYNLHANKDTGKNIRELMHSFGFVPHQVRLFKTWKFDIHNETTFMHDVLFIPKKFSDELLRNNTTPSPKRKTAN